MVNHLTLKHFRCFDQLQIELNQPLTLISGPNGSGKTTILEALHYGCYLRSFRTYSPRDLLNLSHGDSFFIKLSLQDQSGLSSDLQVGYAGKKKVVKINQRPIQSFKELMGIYRAVTLTEDDLQLIKEGPELRRSFIDQALMLFDPEYALQLRNLRSIIENRNALFFQPAISSQSYELWTEQLWTHSLPLQAKRTELLSRLANQANIILNNHFPDIPPIALTYEPKRIKPEASFATFMDSNGNLLEEESRMRRSLFGAHLDDFSINFHYKKSKVYASRGQQKLIAILLKIAHLQELISDQGEAVFLMDDFMTDFDAPTGKTILSLITNLKAQLIVTCPDETSSFQESLLKQGAHHIKLTHRNLPAR